MRPSDWVLVAAGDPAHLELVDPYGAPVPVEVLALAPSEPLEPGVHALYEEQSGAGASR